MLTCGALGQGQSGEEGVYRRRKAKACDSIGAPALELSELV